jgi:hypothetical protein
VSRSGVIAVGVFATLALTLSDGRASLHHPDDPMAIPVSTAGVPEPLPFDEFSRRRAVLMNMMDPNRPLVNPNNPSEKTERGKVAERIEKAKHNPARTPEQSVALAVDLLRFGNAAEAPAALKGQRKGFLPNVTLAHVAAAQGEWGQAFEYLDIANEERPPAAVPGITSAQLAWQMKLNRGALLKLVQSRWKEARAKDERRREGKPAELPPDDELPDPIFSVDFTKTEGAALAPDEKAKLPSDALATVQQLLLWFPGDPRLYWLLAEVYAATGEFATAQRIMDSCVESFKYSNRKVLMHHREAVAKAVRDLTPADPIPPEAPISLRTVALYFGAVAAVALFAGARAVYKWRRRT